MSIMYDYLFGNSQNGTMGFKRRVQYAAGPAGGPKRLEKFWRHRRGIDDRITIFVARPLKLM